MKRLFNLTKRPKEQWKYGQDDDWDEGAGEDEEGSYEDGEDSDGEFYEDEEDVYRDDEDSEGEFYEDEEDVYGDDEDSEGEFYEDEEDVYGDDEDSEGEFYEDEESADGDDEDSEGELYEDEEGAYEEGEGSEGEFYEDEEGSYEDAEGSYEDAEGDYGDGEDAEESASGSDTGKRGIFGSLWAKILGMSGMDRVIAITGAVVLLLAVATAGVYFSAAIVKKQVSEFVAVGKQLEGIDTIGERGLVALADKRLAKITAAAAVEEPEDKKDYQEAEYNKSVTVALDITSIMKDLKIKFTNKQTGKLIANVPFAVTITKPDNKTEIWSDDDMDGIIYKKDIAAGSYKVAANAMDGEQYKSFTTPKGEKTVEVKKDITYKKVDVTNEIKKESEINTAKEEAKKDQIQVESILKDTVAWVESTATATTYREVSKTTIPDPRTLVKSGMFLRMTNVSGSNVSDNDPGGTGGTGDNTGGGNTGGGTGGNNSGNPANLTLNPGEVSIHVGGIKEIEATVEGAADGQVVTAVSSDETVAKVAVAGNKVTVTGVKGGSAAITVTYGSSKAVCPVTVSEVNSIQLDKAEVSLAVGGGTAVVNVSLNNSKTVLSTDVKSSNTKVATVSVAGNKITITGVAAGEAEITATHPDDSTKKAACKVKVTAANSISLDKSTITIISGSSVTIQATLNSGKILKAENVTSSNTGAATVSVADNKITITGVAAGSATITAKHPDDNSKTAACTVTVKDGNSLLKDKDGSQVYIQDGNNYREAKYSDYDAIQQDKHKIFIRGDVKYTGWQTLNGKVYFFDAKGDKVTGEQVIQGAKYQFASDGSLVKDSGAMGIDVSKYNGNIDWNAVKNSGVSYVIIRVGYRGYTQGTLVDDPKFAANIKGATAAGLKVGVYFFTQAIDQVEAVEEASMVLERIRGYTISYPVFLDVEASGGKGRADSLSKEVRTAVCMAFCETIRNAGYATGVYANKTWLTDKIDAGALSAYKIWLAQYAAEPTYKGRYDMWQYKSTGRISGINGDVDMNISYLGY